MRNYLLLTFLGCIFFMPFLGGVHLFDWDEINFAECAREMLVTGDYLMPRIDFNPFWEKPPLFIWFQAISMKIFGVNEFAARFPNAVCGVLTLLVVYRTGKKLFDVCFGWIWAIAWLGSILPHLYFRSGIMDPWFNLLIFSALYVLIQFRWQFYRLHQIRGFWAKNRFLFLSGALLGLAVLVKGPVALLITMLTITIYWAIYRFKKGNGWFLHSFLFFGSVAVVTLLWFGVEYMLHGSWFLKEFITYQIRLFSTPDSGHGGFFAYHFVVLLIGCFPASVFAIPNLWGDRQTEDEVLEECTLKNCHRCDFTTWMQILFWVVLILFSIVKTKIVHYSSLAYFPLTFLAALTLWRAMKYKTFPKTVAILLPALGVIIGAIVLFAPHIGKNIDLIRPYLAHDQFGLENLNAQVKWSYCNGYPGLVLIIGSLMAAYSWHKKGGWKTAEYAFWSGAVFTAFTLIFFISKIEAYTQNAAIEFYKSKIGEDCEIKPIGFKSFANLFYAQKTPASGQIPLKNNQNSSESSQKRKTYFVAKCTNLGDLPQRNNVREISRKNGFVFFEAY